MFVFKLPRVHTLNIVTGQQPFHIRIDFAVAQVPKLDRQRAAEMPQEPHVYPDAGKVLEATAGDDDAAVNWISPARWF